MSKLEEELREIEELIFKSKSLTAKLAKKVESHPLVEYFEEIEFSWRGVYYLHFKPLAPWLRELDVKVGSYATPGWESEFKTGIFLEPDLYGKSKEFDLYFPGDGKGSYSRDNVRIGSDTVNVREYLEFFLPEKTEKMYDELFLVPVKEKKLESIKNVDDYIDWYYGQIDRIIETLKKSLKLVKEVAIDNPMFNKGGKVWDKLNKQAKENHGEFGFATLDYDDMGKYINMKKANKLADKEFAEFGFTTLSESEMEQLVNKYPEIVKKHAHGGELMEADTKFEYSKGGKTEFNWTEKEVRKGANNLAEALSKREGVPFKVHQFEYEKGKGAGFELSMDGEEHMGGSYYVKPDGTMVNAAMSSRGEAKYGNIKDSKAKLIEDSFFFARGGNLCDKNHSKLINNWVMFCFNYPYNFLDAFNDDLNMKKHLLKKFSTLYDRVGADAVMNLFWTQLSVKNQSKLLNWVDKNYKG